MQPSPADGVRGVIVRIGPARGRASRASIPADGSGSGGAVFLPEAYVNDIGAEGDPAGCVAAAAGAFPRGEIHPTIGMHIGARGTVDVATYVELLARAGTVGFSVYLAETRMTDTEWRALGRAIGERGIAAAPG